MTNRDTFSGYHPTVNLLYFALVLSFSMFFMHPVCLVVSLVCALSYNIYLGGRKAVRFSLLYMLPLMLLTMVINPAFNHEGMTILAYLPSGNPLTLESITYGIASAAMLVAVVVWFSCFSTVVTSDKFVYLFGRIIPSMSLVLSMTLRFVPLFRSQIKVVSEAQRCIGRDGSKGGVISRAGYGIRILSIVVTWSLENAIETADSMKSRGFGLKGRTSFANYRFDKRDVKALCFLFGCTAYILVGRFKGALDWHYFPSMTGTPDQVYLATVLATYMALCLMPVIVNIREDRKWIRLRSAI